VKRAGNKTDEKAPNNLTESGGPFTFHIGAASSKIKRPGILFIYQFSSSAASLL
jgi:hypothetical protein